MPICSKSSIPLNLFPRDVNESIRAKMSDHPDEFLPTRRSLLIRLRNWDDQESWRNFFDTYSRLIYGFARKAGFGDAEAQDIVQETVVSVAKHIPQFEYDPALGSFKSWLLQITRSRIIDHVRKKQYSRGNQVLQREEPLGPAVLENPAHSSEFDLESIWDEEWQRHLLDTAMEKVKRLVSPKHYQLFHLHVVKQLPAKTIVERMKVKLPEIYFAKYKVQRLLQKEIKYLERTLM